MSGRRIRTRGEYDVPQRMREAAEDLLEDVLARMADALDQQKTWSELCACGRRVTISYPDMRAMTDAVRLLLEYGFGKPGQQKPPRDPSGLAGKSASDLDPEERALLLDRLRERLQGEDDGREADRAAQEVHERHVHDGGEEGGEVGSG